MGALQIAAVAELRDALRESLAESGELTLELTGVDGCDAAAAAALGLPAEALREAGKGAHTRAV